MSTKGLILQASFIQLPAIRLLLWRGIICSIFRYDEYIGSELFATDAFSIDRMAKTRSVY